MRKRLFTFLFITLLLCSCKTEKSSIFFDEPQVSQTTFPIHMVVKKDAPVVKASFIDQLEVLFTKSDETTGIYDLNNIYVCSSEENSPITASFVQAKNTKEDFLILA